MNNYNTHIISSYGFMHSIATRRPINITRTGIRAQSPPIKSKLILCNCGPNVLYLYADSIPFYLEELKKIRFPFVLLCGDSDIEVTLKNKFIQLILYHPFLKRLYCQNWGSKPHKKVICLPREIQVSD